MGVLKKKNEEKMNRSLINFAKQLQNDLPLTTDDALSLVDEARVLYRQYRVQILENNEKHLIGNVRDKEKEFIVINFKPSLQKSCSCASKEPVCQHQLALFFAAFDRYQSISKWIEAWKTGSEQNEMYQFSYTIDVERELENWIAFFEKAAQKELSKELFRSYYGEYNFVSAYTKAIRSRIPSDPSWANLYLMIGYYFGLKEIWLTEDPKTVTTFYRSKGEYLLDSFGEAVRGYMDNPIPEKAEVVFKQLREETQSSIFMDQDYLLQKWHVYCVFWSKFLASGEDRKAEIERLQASSNHYFSKPALMYLWDVENQSEKAASILNEVELTSFPLLISMMDHYNEQKDFQFVKLIIDWVIEHVQVADIIQVKEALVSPIEHFCTIVIDYVENSQDFDLGEKALKQYMPFSQKEYASLIFEKKDYRKWVDLLMISPENILYRYSEQIATIAKEAPEFLLPIYHFHISLEIASKNRQSYKQAVRYMKKLRTIYKKLKKNHAWEQYLDYIVSSNKRLRAFQSELERGKLISYVE